jgi:hypothetical protein
MTSGKKQVTEIVIPHVHDVLSGRGNFVNYHAGNEHFRALVCKYKLEYVKSPKPEKRKFSRMIVDEIQNRNPAGRFLKQDLATLLWHDIGEKKALGKTLQALREGAPDIKKVITGESGNESENTPSPGTLTNLPALLAARMAHPHPHLAPLALHAGRLPSKNLDKRERKHLSTQQALRKGAPEILKEITGESGNESDDRLQSKNLARRKRKHPSTQQAVREGTSDIKKETTEESDDESDGGLQSSSLKITELGEQFLEFGGSLDSDVGRFLASLMQRKTLATMKKQWLEIVKVSKKPQSSRIYQTIEELIDFCLKSRLID